MLAVGERRRHAVFMGKIMVDILTSALQTAAANAITTPGFPKPPASVLDLGSQQLTQDNFSAGATILTKSLTATFQSNEAFIVVATAGSSLSLTGAQFSSSLSAPNAEEQLGQLLDLLA